MITYLQTLLSPVRIGGSAIHLSQKGISLARRVIEELVDDLDGEAASETIMFSYRGVDYEVDLSEKNAAGLDDALAPTSRPPAKSEPGGPLEHPPRCVLGAPRTLVRSASGRSATTLWSRTAVGCQPLSYSSIKTPRGSDDRW